MLRLGIYIGLIFGLIGLNLASLAEADIDSVEVELEHRQKANKRDLTTIELLKQVSHSYFSTDPLKGIEYAEEAMAIAKEIENKESQADIFNYFGNFYRDQGLLNLALEAHLYSVEFSEHIGDTSRLVYALNDLGNIYYDQKNLDKALELYSRAAELAMHANSIDALPVSYNNIGLVYHQKKDYDRSFHYFAMALKYREEQGLPELVGHSFNYLGMVYRAQGDYRLATEYFGKALQKFKSINNQVRIGDTYLNIGVNYAMQHDYETAFECFEKAKEHFNDSENKIELAHCLQVYGKYQLESGLFEAAKVTLNEALAVMEEHGFRGLRKQTLLLLSHAEENLDNYKDAFIHYRAYSELKDSLSNSETSNKIARLEATFSYREKEKELALLQKQAEFEQQKAITQKLRLKFLLFFMSGLTIVILLILAIRLKPKKRNKLLAEFKTRMAAFLH